MKYIFILYAFDMVDLYIIIYILGQSLHSLTCMKNYAQYKMGKREYGCKRNNFMRYYGYIFTNLVGSYLLVH
jgi:hypothetical protein